ncbi:hypothetical protein M408DRAFT_136154 [Serendipita vermifera MAFF 305830]|uniref:Uncharacterized protein n=1 Tax=Serendipita vermifera MAFF 305830 TaxID=933852 RepID=A0A0C2XHF3_SERVB|nr:hypothetical protein M408DRAFT_136154 [Serendipita vermifera MAFF 305830]
MFRDKSRGLSSYISHSEGPNIRIPLDIEIRWLPAKDRAADHLSTCMVSPLEVFECRDSRCNLFTTRRDQLCQLLEELGGPSPLFEVSPTKTPYRICRWRSLLLDLEGLFDSISQREHVSLRPLGFSEFRLLPNLELLSIRNAQVPNFYIDAPKLRHLELDRAINRRHLGSGGLEEMTIYGTEAFDSINLLKYHTLKTLEVWSTMDWTLPVHFPFASLTTIVLDTSGSSKTLDSIGEIFNESRPLENLVILGMSPEGLSYLLLYSPKLRCRYLYVSSHCFVRSSGRQRRHYRTGVDGWVGISGSGMAVTRGDIQSTKVLLLEMRARGTRVFAVETHMDLIMQMVRKECPDL